MHGNTGGLLFLMVIIYIIPILVSAFRGHNNIASISALNILLGWTGLGWAAALIWSLSDQEELTKNSK